MCTLIIPCAGSSSRFPNMRPKWLLTHPDGKIMVEKAFDGIKHNKFNRIIITILEEHATNHEADLWLKQVFGNQIEICILNRKTLSQSETVYQTLVNMNVSGCFCVKDSDGYIEVDLKGENFVVGKDIRSMPELTNVPGKSFVLKNEQDILTDIIEKSVSSNHVSIGIYGFSSAQKYQKKFTELNEFVKSEIYPSHVISSLIGEGSIFKYIEANDYKDWGTLNEWQTQFNKLSTYLIDIDGVVFKNKGKYGSTNWSSEDIPLEKNINHLKKIQNMGGQFIFVTSRTEEYREKTQKSLENNGLIPHCIVMGCYHSKRYLINDFAKTNPYPSSISINIVRDSDDLENYI